MQTHHIGVGLLGAKTHGRERTRAHDDPQNLDGRERDCCRGERSQLPIEKELDHRHVELLTDREAVLVLESETDEKDERLHDVSYGENADQ